MRTAWPWIMVIHAPRMACRPDIGVESSCQLVPEPSRLMAYGHRAPSCRARRGRAVTAARLPPAPELQARMPTPQAGAARGPGEVHARTSGDATRKPTPPGRALRVILQ